jgi:hypothetical protein
MGACTSNITVKGTVKEVLEKVTPELKKNGVTLSGDENKGTLKHKDFKGSYTTDGKHKITMTITDSPWYATCGVIDEKIQEYFKGK